MFGTPVGRRRKSKSKSKSKSVSGSVSIPVQVGSQPSQHCSKLAAKLCQYPNTLTSPSPLGALGVLAVEFPSLHASR
jgi:hypothetical protein